MYALYGSHTGKLCALPDIYIKHRVILVPVSRGLGGTRCDTSGCIKMRAVQSEYVSIIERENFRSLLMLGIFRTLNAIMLIKFLSYNRRDEFVDTSQLVNSDVVNFPARFTLFCAPAILAFIACRTSHSFSSTSRKLELQDVIDSGSERSYSAHTSRLSRKSE